MFFRLRPLKLRVLEKQWKNRIKILVQKFSEMQFQPIWSASFSKFSGGACPQTPLAGQKFCPAAARRRQIFVSHLEPTHIFGWIRACHRADSRIIFITVFHAHCRIGLCKTQVTQVTCKTWLSFERENRFISDCRYCAVSQCEPCQTLR